MAHKYAFAKECSRDWKVSTGTKFLQKVNLLIASLGIHYHGHEDVKAKLTPQASAWLAEHCKSIDNPRAFEDFAIGLQAYNYAKVNGKLPNRLAWVSTEMLLV